MKINTLFRELASLFFPQLCVMCSNKLLAQEKIICLACLCKLPKTNNFNEPDNAPEKLMAGRIPFERIAAFCIFSKKGTIAPLIHHLKYRNRDDIGIFLGEMYGKELLGSEFLQSIDLIVPVPLHPKKRKKRGYNQAEMIAKGLSKIASIPLSINNLIRTIHNPTQTKFDKTRRWENVKDIFDVKNPDEFEGKHILLVDDVITTGSTLEGCGVALQKCNDIKISILAIGQAL
jgi:ComF family protein